MIGRTNVGGGGAGGTLTVTAPAAVTVTVSKDGKTKTKTADSTGTAVFKGLASGTWTLTITDGVHTSTKSVAITADYSAAITFFSATIHVTYPAGSVCTATDGVTTLTAPDSSGTWDCVVPNAGTWAVSLDSGFRETVQITLDGQIETIDKWYLYNLGDEHVSLTGGWKGENRMASSNVGTFAKGTNSLSSKNVSNATYGQTMVNAVDFTGYSTLHALVKTSTASVVAEMAVADDFPENDTSIPLTSGTIGTTQTEMTLDISAVNDLKKVHLRAKSTAAYLYTYKVWLT